MVATTLPEKVDSTPTVTYRICWYNPDSCETETVHEGLTKEQAEDKLAHYREFHAYKVAE